MSMLNGAGQLKPSKIKFDDELNKLELKAKLLRLDFVRDEMKIALAVGDVYKFEGASREWVAGVTGMSELYFTTPSALKDNPRFIKSFAPRKNEGVQPVGDDVVVDVECLDGGKSRGGVKACLYDWEVKCHPIDIKTYTPNYDALLKMQNEFDEKESEMITDKEMKIVEAVNESRCSLTNPCGGNIVVTPKSSNRTYKIGSYYDDVGETAAHGWNLVCTIAEFNQCIEEMAEAKWLNKSSRCDYLGHIGWCRRNNIDTSSKRPQKEAQPIYTKAMQDAGGMPSVGMSFICNDNTADSRISDFHKREVEVIGVSKLDGKSILTFSHPTMGIGCGVFDMCWITAIETRTPEEIEAEELEVAKVKQSMAVAESLKNIFGNELSTGADFMSEAATLQDEGHLAEIVLPSKE